MQDETVWLTLITVRFMLYILPAIFFIGKVCYQLTGSSDFNVNSLLPVKFFIFILTRRF